MSIDDTQTIKWHVDMLYASISIVKLEPQCPSGKGVITSLSTMQKVNTRSSTQAKLVGLDDVLSKIHWTKRFMETQGFEVKTNIVYRDNISADKRTSYFNINYSNVTDIIESGELKIKYCLTDDMIAD